VISQ